MYSRAASRVVSRKVGSLVRPISTNTFVAADQNIDQFRVYHKSHFASLALVPLAFLAPSSMALPVDLALAVVLPVHAHIGMNWIFTDYVPGSPTGAPRVILLVSSVLATLGLIKLSFQEPGVVGTVKALWRKKETKTK